MQMHFNYSYGEKVVALKPGTVVRLLAILVREQVIVILLNATEIECEKTLASVVLGPS